jgi:nitrate/TMAO reductase-like tetraheme cytochrome c subunit
MLIKYHKQLCVFAIVWLGFIYGDKTSSFAREPNALIPEKCVACHNLDRVYCNKMSVQRWTDTLKRMQAKSQGGISGQQVAEIVDSLIVNNLTDRKLLFEKRCLDCHQGISKTNKLLLRKTKLGWQRAIERMRRKYCMFIGIDEAEEIAVYWTDPKNNPNLKLDQTEYDRLEGVFENKCGACHSYKFLYGHKHNISDWKGILSRMKQKSPIILLDIDLKDIQDYLLQTKSLLVK